MQLKMQQKSTTDINYVLIDDVIKDQKNVASVTFADNEAAYLAGVAAAKTTKTKQVGFCRWYGIRSYLSF